VSSGEAFASFGRHYRGLRRWYFLAVTVVGALAVTFFVVEVASGEISHVHSTLATDPRPHLSAVSLRTQLAEAWNSTDSLAEATPYDNATVVTYSTHTVTGRDARTGAQRWSFTRSDRTICDVVQKHNRTVALFEVKGDCVEVTALRTDTGARAWERTLFSDGHLVSGHPDVLTSEDTVAFVTPTLIWALVLDTGGDRWISTAAASCRNAKAVWGDAGVLASQHCSDGDYLSLRAPYAGELSDDNKADPVKWRVKTQDAATPLLADAVILTASDTTGALTRHSAANGHVLPAAQLSAAQATSGGHQTSVDFHATRSAGLLLVCDGSYLYALSAEARNALWSAPATHLPDLSELEEPLATAPVIALAEEGKIVTLDPLTGQSTGTFTVSASHAGSRIFHIGSGFLLANAVPYSKTTSEPTTRTVVYQ